MFYREAEEAGMRNNLKIQENKNHDILAKIIGAANCVVEHHRYRFRYRSLVDMSLLADVQAPGLSTTAAGAGTRQTTGICSSLYSTCHWSIILGARSLRAPLVQGT